VQRTERRAFVRVCGGRGRANRIHQSFTFGFRRRSACQPAMDDELLSRGRNQRLGRS
jgi:hypothetical protein